MPIVPWPEESQRKFEARVKALHESSDLEDQVVAVLMDWEMGAAHPYEDEYRIRARKAIAVIRRGNSQFCSALWDFIQAAKETGNEQLKLHAEKVERLM